MNVDRTIGFIGAGKVGTALGRYFSEGGLFVAGYASARRDSAELAASRVPGAQAYDDPAELARGCDLIFVTTPDGKIADAWQELRATCDLSGKILAHCSGSLSAADAFPDAAEAGADTCSAHPLLAVSNPLLPLDELRAAHVTLEGDPAATSVVRAIFDALGNPTHTIDSASKTRYHAAAVYASNLVLAPLAVAGDLMESCGFTAAEAREALTPLVMGNAHAACELGARDALTGPVERNDLDTAQRHLSVLDENQASLYRELTAELVRLAESRHPDRDYAAWSEIAPQQTAQQTTQEERHHG